MKSLLLFFLFMPFFADGQVVKLDLLEFKTGMCDRDADIFRVQQRIVSQQMDGKLFKLSVGLLANCAGVHNVVAILESDTLKISYKDGIIVLDTALNGKVTELVDEAKCDCCFEFQFVINGLSELPKAVTVNDSVIVYHPEKYKIYEVKYELRKGDTVNVVDRYGLKQGKWFEDKENGGYFKGIYLNDRLKSEDSRAFYANGNLKSWRIQTDFEKSKEEHYYENGTLSYQSVKNDSMHGTSSSYYENGSVKRSNVSSSAEDRFYSLGQWFYPNGNVQKISGNYIHHTYYENGELKSEWSFVGHDIIYRFYYEDGQVAAFHEVRKKEMNRQLVTKKRGPNGKILKSSDLVTWEKDDGETWKYYDKKGKRMSKKKFIVQGFDLSTD